MGSANYRVHELDSMTVGVTHGGDIATDKHKRRIGSPGDDARVVETEYDHIDVIADKGTFPVIEGSEGSLG